MMKTLIKMSNFAGKKMAYIVIVVAVLSYLKPTSFSWAVPQIGNLLGIIMFGMGMTLSKKDFQGAVKNPKTAFIGVALQYTLMPITALLVAKILRLPPELAVGVILVGTCPGGTSSNVMTYLAKGDIPLSLSMTVISTLLSPFLTPAITLLLAGKWIPISVFAMFVSIVKVVLVPVIIGFIVKKLFTNTVEKITEVLPLVSVVSIVTIVGAVVGINSERIATTGAIMMVAVVMHNCLGYLFGYTAGKMLKIDESKMRAISIEVGMQNSGLASSLAMAHFTPMSAIAGALFSVWHNISGSILANYWAGKSEVEEVKKVEAVS